MIAGWQAASPLRHVCTSAAEPKAGATSVKTKPGRIAQGGRYLLLGVDYHPWPGSGAHRSQPLSGELRVKGDRDRPHGGDREQRRHVVSRARQVEPDPVTGAHAGGSQLPGSPVDLMPEPLIGNLAVHVDDRGALRALRRGGPDQVRQVCAGHVTAPFPRPQRSPSWAPRPGSSQAARAQSGGVVLPVRRRFARGRPSDRRTPRGAEEASVPPLMIRWIPYMLATYSHMPARAASGSRPRTTSGS